MAVLYAKGCMEVKQMELWLRPKECIEYDKQSFSFDERLSKGEREFFSLTSTTTECPQTILFLNQILM